MIRPLPPLAAVLSFIDAINCGDLERLGRLMSDDHRLLILDEPPVEGRAANLRAWRGYMTAFPLYVIHPARMAAREGRVAVLGTTTGSHLALPDEEEMKQPVLWLGTVEDGRLSTWQIVPDSAEQREALGLSGEPAL